MADDAAFQDGILDALQEYNTKQYITVKLPGQENQVTSINLHKIHRKYILSKLELTEIICNFRL